jgi:hypothetical protein
MSVSESIAAGLRALPGRRTAFASTQAAWRFYRNPAVTLPCLVEPLHQAARLAAESELAAYARVIHDWSELFGDHAIATAILDRILHHAHVFSIRGNSYCLRERMLELESETPQAPASKKPPAAAGA